MPADRPLGRVSHQVYAARNAPLAVATSARPNEALSAGTAGELRMPSALALFERHHRAVFRFLRRWAASVEEAEDLTQEVFVQVVRSLPRYKERQRERAWVFQIARNLWLDRLRSRGRVPPHEPLEARKAPVPARQGLQAALAQALAGLKDTEREAFLLREVGGLGYGEIARLTGGTEGAVRNRIYRARLALRMSLGGEGGALHGPREGGRE